MLSKYLLRYCEYNKHYPRSYETKQYLSKYGYEFEYKLDYL